MSLKKKLTVAIEDGKIISEYLKGTADGLAMVMAQVDGVYLVIFIMSGLRLYYKDIYCQLETSPKIKFY